MPKASATRSAVPERGTDHSFKSPLGWLTVTEEEGALMALSWSDTPPRATHIPATALLAEAEAQIAAYFAGRRRSFDLPLAPRGSDFQKKVWTAIAAIPLGASETYGSLARKLETAPRPVGGAAGANPLPIIVPCHRVLGAGGTLHGYSGHGGTATKAALLRLEGIPFTG